MTKKLKQRLKNTTIGVLIGAVVMVTGGSVIAQSTGLDFLTISDYQFLLKMILNGAQEAPVAPAGSVCAFGGSTQSFFDAAQGFRVNGTTVIDSSGNVDAPITSTSGTFSSTLSVEGESNLARTIMGGSVFATSTGVTSTPSAAQICDNAVYSLTPTNDCLSLECGLELPATTTLEADCLPARGDHLTFLYENAATQASSTKIIVPSGYTLISDDNGGDIVAENGWAQISIWNISAAQFTAIIKPYLDTD